jgi:hypothetical protein
LYHVRNHIPQEELKAGKRMAARQTEVVRGIFEDNKDRTFTPFEVQHMTQAMGYDYNINGIRRSITDLANEGLLRKTDGRRLGDLGSTNRTWIWNKPTNQLRLYESRTDAKKEDQEAARAKSQCGISEGGVSEKGPAHGTSAKAGEMTPIESAAESFLAANPTFKIIESVYSAGEVVGCLVRRGTDGREFYFTAVEGVKAGDISCPTKLVNDATALKRGLLIHMGRDTFAFRLADVHKNIRGTSLTGKVQYLQIPGTLGVDIKTFGHSIVQKIIDEFGATQAQSEIFDAPTITTPKRNV